MTSQLAPLDLPFDAARVRALNGRLDRVKHGATGKGSLYEAACRCSICVGAHNARHRALRAKPAAQRPEDNPLLSHGALSTQESRMPQRGVLSRRLRGEPAPSITNRQTDRRLIQ